MGKLISLKNEQQKRIINKFHKKLLLKKVNEEKRNIFLVKENTLESYVYETNKNCNLVAKS